MTFDKLSLTIDKIFETVFIRNKIFTVVKVTVMI